MEKQKTIAITGANGYVGSVISGYLKKKGWIVYELVRTKVITKGDQIIPFDLEGKSDISSLKGIDVLVHCAYSFKERKWSDIERVNIRGTEKLIKSARLAGINRIIFISSVAAYEGCLSMYGQAKLQLEKKVQQEGGIIIRPGLVYGLNPGGLFGKLEEVVSYFSIIPLIKNGNQPIFLIHQEDLAKLVYRSIISCKNYEEPIIAANKNKKTIREILISIGKKKNKNLYLLSLPSGFVQIGLSLAETVGITMDFSKDNLISFLNPDKNPDFSLPKELMVNFREFDLTSLTTKC